MITEEKKTELKKKLEEEKASIEKEIERLEKVPDFGHDVTELEDEPADEAEEYSTNLGIADTYKERLNEVNDALKKLEEGKYGLCEKCGDEIDEELIAANPESRLCRNCKLEK